MRNEITDLLIEELEKYGLKGQIEHRTKHLEVSWYLPSGARRFIIAPATPSEWRGGLNARSDLRKMLRADNLSLKQDDPRSFNRAISMPKESIVTQVARDRALIRDVETLSDLVLELQEQNSQLLTQMGTMLEKMNSISVVSTVMSNVSFVGQQVVVEQPQPQVVYKKPAEVSVLSVMTFEYMDVQEIIRLMNDKTTAKSCRAQLQYNLRKKRVERGLRGQYRKKPNDNVTFLRSGGEGSA